MVKGRYIQVCKLNLQTHLISFSESTLKQKVRSVVSAKCKH